MEETVRVLSCILSAKCREINRGKVIFNILDFFKSIKKWHLFCCGSFFDFFNSFNSIKKDMFDGSLIKGFL